MTEKVQSFLSYIRCELNHSAHTVSAYGRDLDGFVDFITGSRPEEFDPESVTSADVRAFVATLSQSGLSVRTIRRKLSAVRAFYCWLRRTHNSTANPADRIATARLPRQLPVFVKTDEINAVIDAPNYDSTDFESVRNRLMIDMFYSTGIRCSELMTLRDADVNT
ncbi:MAG: site-specific integrase, partial [Muribaculaceae bacterium]|nr:site-specific integrase [Muribaculaceae bacterium]